MYEDRWVSDSPADGRSRCKPDRCWSRRIQTDRSSKSRLVFALRTEPGEPQRSAYTGRTIAVFVEPLRLPIAGTLSLTSACWQQCLWSPVFPALGCLPPHYYTCCVFLHAYGVTQQGKGAGSTSYIVGPELSQRFEPRRRLPDVDSYRRRRSNDGPRWDSPAALLIAHQLFTDSFTASAH